MKETVLFLLITGFSLTCWGQQKAQQSFDELVTAHDPDVADDLKHDVSYVCFEPKEEKFFIVFYNLPDPASWQDAYSWETVATRSGRMQSNLEFTSTQMGWMTTNYI